MAWQLFADMILVVGPVVGVVVPMAASSPRTNSSIDITGIVAASNGNNSEAASSLLAAAEKALSAARYDMIILSTILTFAHHLIISCHIPPPPPLVVGFNRTQADLTAILPSLNKALTLIAPNNNTNNDSTNPTTTTTSDTKLVSLFARLLECRCFLYSKTNEHDLAIGISLSVQCRALNDRLMTISNK
jgi:hypothetical protein